MLCPSLGVGWLQPPYQLSHPGGSRGSESLDEAGKAGGRRYSRPELQQPVVVSSLGAFSAHCFTQFIVQGGSLPSGCEPSLRSTTWVRRGWSLGVGWMQQFVLSCWFPQARRSLQDDGWTSLQDACRIMDKKHMENKHQG